MRSQGIVAAAMFWVLASTAWQPALASAASYEETVERAEQLWAKGGKNEAVQLYGSIWRLNPDDVDRQILYGERSAEVGNYRWALNFFRVAEPKVKDDPKRLSRVYAGYAKVYRLSGSPDRAQPYEEKAAALRMSLKTDKTTSQPIAARAYYFGYYTEAPPGTRATTPLPRTGVPPLKKRIALAPISVAAGREGLANYGKQIQTMLIAELRKTDRFLVVEWENLESIPARQDLTVSGRAVEGTKSRQGRLVGAQLLVKAKITNFEEPPRQERSGQAEPAESGRREHPVRVTLGMGIYDAETSVAIASETMTAGGVSRGQDLDINASDFRWDDPKSQTSALGVVTRDLVRQAIDKIVANSEKLAWRASVRQATENEVHINAGWQENVRVGGRFKVLSVGPLRTDPVTGQVLRAEEKNIGEIEIVRIEEKSAVGRVVKKTGEIRQLDRVVAP